VRGDDVTICAWAHGSVLDGDLLEVATEGDLAEKTLIFTVGGGEVE